MASLADMTVTLGLDDKDFTRGINNAEKNVEKFGKTADSSLSHTAKLFDTLKTALAGIAFGELIRQSAQFGSDIVNTARSLQTSTEAVYAWRQSIGNAGGDLDNARDALIDLTQKMSEAITSGGDVLTAFNRIGLSVADLQKMSNEDIMKAVIKGLANVKDGAERSRLALVLMGEDVKNVDWRSVANDYDKMAASAKSISPALESAQKAQKQFNETYNRFIEQLTINVPWDDLASGLKSLSDNIENIKSLISSLVSLGLAFGVITKVIPLLRAQTTELYSSIDISKKGVSLFGAANKAVASEIDLVTTNLKNAKGSFDNIFTGANKAVGSLDSARFSFLALATAASRLFILYEVTTAINDLIKAASGLDILDSMIPNTNDWADFKNELEEVAKYYGYIEKTAKEERAYRDNVKKIAEEQLIEETKIAEQKDKSSKLLEDQKKSLEQIHSQYRNQNEQALAKLRLDNSLIGASEEQKRVQSELMNIENQRQQVVQGLKDKIAEATDPALMEQYTAAIEKTNAAFAKQKEEVATLMLNGQEKELITRLQNIADQKHIENQQTLRDLSNEQANVFMPAIAQQYRNIEQAAEDAYNAMLEAEKVHWAGQSVENIPQSVKNELRELAYANVQAEKDKKTAIEETNNAKKFSEFLSQTELDNAREVRRINNDLVLSIMPAYQQIGAKLTNDAKERAQATIDEINATRGYKMSAAEAQAYYDAAEKGLDKVIAKQQESYKISRQWSTGWNNAMNDYIENATNAAKVAENVFSKAMQGMEDMFIDFVKTGKFEWKDFVNSMLEELLRAQFRQTIASIFTGGGQGAKTGSSSGGLLSGLGNLFSGFFAEGGNIPAGNWGIVGEKGPEIITGPANITPMNKLASESTNVTYHINAVDALSFKQMIAADPTFLYAVSEQGRRRLPGGR